MSADDGDDLLLTEELVPLTRLSADTLRYYRSKGKGPAWFKPGRRVLYRRSAVMAWIREQEQKSQAQQASEHRQAS